MSEPYRQEYEVIFAESVLSFRVVVIMQTDSLKKRNVKEAASVSVCHVVPSNLL